MDEKEEMVVGDLDLGYLSVACQHVSPLQDVALDNLENRQDYVSLQL